MYAICPQIYPEVPNNDTYHNELHDALNNVQYGNESCEDLFCEASEQFYQDTALKTNNHKANNSQPKAYI